MGRDPGIAQGARNRRREGAFTQRRVLCDLIDREYNRTT